MSKTQKWVSFFIIAMTGGIVFQVAYIRFVFLEATFQALQLSAQDYGNIISVYGIVAMFSYFPGGWLADKFSPKKLVAIAMIGTALCNFYIASVPGYYGTLIAHIVMALMGMVLYWSAMVKSIGMLGDSNEQGRMFGYLEGVRGVISTIVGFAGTAIVGAMAAPTIGVLWLIRIYGILAIVLGILTWFVVKEDPTRYGTDPGHSVTLRQLANAVKNPYTWLVGGTIMAIYCSYTSLTYFSPLLRHQYGLSAGLIGVIGVIRSYVFQFVAGPVSGIVTDKVAHSTPRFLRWMLTATAITTAIFLLMPRQPSLVWIALTLMFILTFFIFACRGVYWATIGEVGIKENERGGVIGIASGIAYLPDAVLPSLAAWWTGDPTASPPVPEHGGGYTTLFIFLITMCLLGIVLTTVTMRKARRDAKELVHA